MTTTNLIVGMRRGFLFLLCGSVVFIAGCSDRRSEQMRAEGDTRRDLNQFELARVAYEQSIEANPENPRAKLGLALCDVASNQTDEALSLFDEVIALDPTIEEAYVEAAQSLLKAKRLEEALAMSERYAGQFSEKGGIMKGVILSKMGRADDAISTLKSLLETHANSEEIRLSLGAAYLEGGQIDAAEKLFHELTEGSTNVASAARMGLIDIYRAQGKLEELVAEFAELAESRPDDMGVKLGYARSLLLVEEREKAETLAREVLEQDPESGWANFIVGFNKVESGYFEEARAFLVQAARALPDNKEVGGLLAYAESGGTTERETETPVVAKSPVVPVGVDSTTWQGLWKQAALNRLLQNRDMYLADGGEEAREVLTLAALFTYQAVLSRELADGLPEESKVRGFIDAFLSKDASKVAALFEGWKTEEPEETQLHDNALGFAMVSSGARERGLSVFLFCLERWPDQGVALFNIAQVFRRLGQPMIAAQNLQRLIAMYPENIDAHQMHYTALREGRAFSAARQAAEASFALFPEEKWTHIYLCQSYLDTNDPGLALQRLGRATTQFPDDPELQTILGKVLVRVGDCEQATTVLEAISTTAPAIIADRAAMLALCRDLNGDTAGAMEIAQSVAGPNRNNPLAVLLAALLVEKGEREAALATLMPVEGRPAFGGQYGTILAAALGADIPALKTDEKAWAVTLSERPALFTAYATASALILADLNDAAWTYYQAHLASETPHIALVQIAFQALGGADSIEDVPGEARKIVEMAPNDGRAWLGLASLLKERKDMEGEKEAIQKALDVAPESPEALFRHAELMERDGSIAEAVADYRKLVELLPDNGPANNNLAYTLLLQGGNDEEALKHATMAVEKRPRDAGVLHTLGLAQMRTGDLEESRKNLQRATEMDPANPTIMYDYGRLLAQLDEKNEAEKRIRYALAMSRNAGIDFPQAAEAEALVETLK